MAFYNTKHEYNKSQKSNGMTYNYRVFKIIINIFEAINVNDVSRYIYTYMHKREQMKLTDLADAMAYNKVNDTVRFDEGDISINAFIDIIEKTNVSDLFFNIMVNVHVHENTMRILDEVRSMASWAVTEEFVVSDDKYITALMELADRLNLQDARDLFAYLDIFEDVGITDHDPKTAVSDFFIGKGVNLDTRFDHWLVPFDLLVDPRKSDIAIMPPTEITQVDIPYTDGSIDLDTVYKNRMFSIVAYSMDGLTIHEKEELKQTITELLDLTKGETKKLTIAKNALSFDVKYSGQLQIDEAPSWIRATIPFEASAYGTELFPQEFFGNGIIVNEGHAPIGFKVIVTGTCLNPNFRVGSTEFLWEGTVPSGKSLVIDSEDKTCYLVDSLGVKEQAMQHLKKGNSFVSINKGTQMVVTALNEQTKNNMTTNYEPRYLWKTSLADIEVE